ncbi:MAG: hypothetical protein RL693_949 [Verrucomicrobiota bacterium]|jgi:hypothetical protein
MPSPRFIDASKNNQPFMKKRLLNSLTLALVSLCFGQAYAAEQKATDTPTVTVTAPADTSILKEDALVGPYNQPEWTGHRRFTTTRVYIQKQPWEIGVEQWWRVRTYDGKPTKHLFIQELEIGLPHRMQLDLYYDWVHENGETESKDFAVELRWALADWGKIPLNPTLYGEYKFTDDDYGSDVFEFKLLLGDDFGPRWHWGLNFAFEAETGGEEKANEFAVTQGIGYTIIDQVLSAGLEMQFKYENTKGNRDNGEHKFQIGPSLQWRLSKNTHLDLVGMFGCTDESPSFEGFVVFGYDFGGREPKKTEGYKPVSGARL